ncbi:uncharacterized protein LOC116199494 [Punica granatum]|uniref:Uncharacterized protein LOC116199494 n=1 Tax=Punica granatum TaxID=22663 RepID=A0A6P8D2H5_PUNGR|nr:uncharacterized protein LOC116199494 [Punica granatum]
MATRRRREGIVGIFLLITAVLVDSAQARRKLASSNKSNDVEFAQAPRGTVKSVQSGGGDVVDCVDIYKQPAFDHPLLKNHTIQMKPSFTEEGESHLQGLPAELEEWGVDCPEGTVPIIRMTSENAVQKKDYVPPFPVNEKSGLHKNPFLFSLLTIRDMRHYAIVKTIENGRTFHGGQALLNVWNPHAETGEASISQIWIYAGSEETPTLKEIYAGLDSRPTTTFFTYWTSDGYKSTGCYNLRCSGFVQTSKHIAPGFQVRPTSTFNGQQFEIGVQIIQDMSTQHWWLRLNNMDIGYWPSSIFNSLRGGGLGVHWGGEIHNFGRDWQHTTTQMGSGHFPRDGYFTKSSYIRNLAYIQNNGSMQRTPKEDLVVYITNPRCYDLVLGPSNLNFETHFYFGGPGFSAQCIL